MRTHRVARLLKSATAVSDALRAVGLKPERPLLGCFDGHRWRGGGTTEKSLDPSSGEVIGQVVTASVEDVQGCIRNAVAAKRAWASVPAPVRGDIVRSLGVALREKKEALATILTYEVGKIHSEALGEVQEFADICDFACGLSRMLGGKTLPSERPEHMLLEMWNPLGVAGFITAFNFPVATFGWNAALSLVCGNTQVWKGAPTTNLIGVATTALIAKVLHDHHAPPGVATAACGGTAVGEVISASHDVNLVAFTGSTSAGAAVARTVQARWGKTLLELGGNNAAIVMPDADLDVVLPSVVFGSAGTCGQRCTTLRRLYVHEDVYASLVPRIAAGVGKLPIGPAWEKSTLVGPLHTAGAVEMFKDTVARAVAEGGKVLTGGTVGGGPAGGNYVRPTVVEIDAAAPCVLVERFVPVLYVMKIKSLGEAIAHANASEHGLSGAIFTRDVRTVGEWIGPHGSYTGVVNVNTSTSGAEIGGAFGGEKATGGGRQSGSDAWKQYCRRSTVTLNMSNAVPLAQGVSFS